MREKRYLKPFASGGRVLPAAVLAVLFISGCASLQKPEDHASKSEWMKAVQEYRKEYSEHPADYEIKMKLQEAELNAAEAYYDDGMSLKDQGLLDDAIYQFREGLSAMPNNEKVSNALQQALKEKESNTFYQQAVDLDKAGKEDDAQTLLNQALAANPDHEGAKALLQKIEAENEAQSGGQVFTSREPVSLHFNHTGLKSAFGFIGKSFGVNVIFDSDMKDQDVTLTAENVTFEQALDLIQTTTQTFYKQIGANTILVADDTKEKEGQYKDMMIKTIQLKSAKAADMANLLKSVLDLKHVVVNEELNTLLIRDTKDVLDLAEEIIAVNDRAPAEVLLDVEILEVDRNKTEQLGLDYGQALPVSFATNTISTVAGSNFGDILGQGS
ncbi:MAG TPA: secretin N-terminal domain-containing protein, partial [bacterium]|nr:secretin N-terminal domain-containing protein [bacterium]